MSKNDFNDYKDNKIETSLRKTKKTDKPLSNSTRKIWDTLDKYLKRKTTILKFDLKKVTAMKMFFLSAKRRPFTMITFLVSCMAYATISVFCVMCVYYIASLIFANHIANNYNETLELLYNKMFNIEFLKKNNPGKSPLEVDIIKNLIDSGMISVDDPKITWDNFSNLKDVKWLFISNHIEDIKNLPHDSLWYYLYNQKESSVNNQIANYFPLGNIKYDKEGCTVNIYNIFIFTQKKVAILLCALLLINCGVAILRGVLSSSISNSTEKDLRLVLANKLIYHDYEFYITNSNIDLIDTYIEGPKNIASFIKSQQIVIFNLLMTVPGALFIMLTIDIKMSIIVCALVSTYTIFSYCAFRIAFNVERKKESNSRNDNNDFSERLKSARLIKSSGTWEYEYFSMKGKVNRTSKKTAKLIKKDSLQSPFIIGVIMCLIFSPFIAGSIIHSKEPQTLVESLSAFTVTSFMMISCLFPFQHTVQLQKKSKIFCLKITDILEKEMLIEKSAYNNIDFSGLRSSIVFEDVTFAYPDNPEDIVFENLNLEINYRDKVGLVGESGCGKSTLLKLLLGFYKIVNGRILIDGIELNRYSLSSWLEKVSYIDQSPQLFSISVFENVRYGMPDKTLDEVIDACKKAKIHDFIMSLPEKYNTVLDSRGERLSGGQRQLIVFARLFLKKSDIIIVDEATANLDPATEKIIMVAFRELIKDATVISISHKLSLLKSFNRIVVMAPKVGIIKTGSYDMLNSQLNYFTFLNFDWE